MQGRIKRNVMNWNEKEIDTQLTCRKASLLVLLTFSGFYNRQLLVDKAEEER